MKLDTIVANLIVASRNDGYVEGYCECKRHVTEALNVDWNTQYSGMHVQTTDDEFVSAQETYNNLRLPIMDPEHCNMMITLGV
ncbi:hypothetical protein Hanom_Chr14g01282041 [Helianthus anomalus]